MKQTNTEYSTRITELSTKLNQVTEEAKSKEIEKENQPPNPSIYGRVYPYEIESE